LFKRAKIGGKAGDSIACFFIAYRTPQSRITSGFVGRALSRFIDFFAFRGQNFAKLRDLRYSAGKKRA
ncbi:MAG: hypothetical protein LBT81_06345, partial [Helicobacteraceae bacterium]|nr:hypothetical protein [Helicobacteraceae bacterium]